MWKICESTEMHTGFWWGNQKARERLKEERVDGEWNFKMTLQELIERGIG